MLISRYRFCILLLSGVVLTMTSHAETLTRDLIIRQAAHFSPSSIQMEDLTVGEPETISLYLVNDSSGELVIPEPVISTDWLSTVSLPEQLAAGDSALVVLLCDLPSNARFHSYLFLSPGDTLDSAVLSVSAAAHTGDDYDADTFDLWGEELKDALYDRVNFQTVLSYTDARTAMFGTIDNEDGWVECVYTGERLQTWGIPDHTVMNTEHTWPQSMGAEGDARSDLNHLFPTMSVANSVRGNLPFGNVVNADWESGGSFRGTNSSGTQVFEPRDVHKGDAARALFYFALRYGNRENFLTSQETVLREWSAADTVSQKELDRNDSIESYQHKRNPFIDHPEFIDRISSLSATAQTPDDPEILLTDTRLDLGAPAWSDTVSRTLYIGNYGYGPSAIDATIMNPYSFQLGDCPGMIEPGDLIPLTVTWAGYAGSEIITNLTIATDTGDFDVELVVHPNAESVRIAPVPVYHTLSVFPNPFNPTTQVTLNQRNIGPVHLVVYNSLGMEVAVLADRILPAGLHRFAFNGSEYPSGIYFCQLNGKQTARMLLVR